MWVWIIIIIAASTVSIATASIWMPRMQRWNFFKPTKKADKDIDYHCSGCDCIVSPSAKFCPECGKKFGDE